METEKIKKRAKVLNWVEIAITIAMFLFFRVTNILVKNVKTQEEFNSIARVEALALIFTAIISIVVIIMTIVLMTKNQKRVKGLGLLLASGIVTLIFSLAGVMIGLIVWILSGSSLKMLKEKSAEDDLESQIPEDVSTDVDATTTIE